MRSLTNNEGLILGDGSKIFLIDKNGGIYDKSFYLDGSSGLHFAHFGLFDKESRKIEWFNVEHLETQKYLEGIKGIETVFNFDKTKIIISDFLVNGIFNRRIHMFPKRDIYAVFKFFPERANEAGCIVKEDFVVSFKSLDGEKDILYIPALRKNTILGPFFYFDREKGYPIHAYEIKDIRAFAKKFEKLIREKEHVHVKMEWLSPYFSIVFHTLPINFLYVSTREKLTNALEKLKNVEVQGAEFEKDIDKYIVKALTNKNTGFPIAGIEYEDPLLPYQSSGGYGYTWFRDAVKLLEAFPKIQKKFFTFFIKKGYSDIPQRVWAFDGSIAPGWANGHLTNQPWRYQLDQLASFLADYSTYLIKKEKIVEEEKRLLLNLSYKLFERSYEDGMPLVCQNCWEDHIGIFSQTAGTYLSAFNEAGKCLHKYGFENEGREMIRRANRLKDSIKIFWKNGAFRFCLGFPEKTYVNKKSWKELKRVKYRRGRLVNKLDSGTFELINALIIYYPQEYKNEIISHLDKAIPHSMISKKPFCFKGLWKKTNNIEGLVRYQGDLWRKNRGKYPEKIWSVSTLEGCLTLINAAKMLTELFGEKEIAKEFTERSLHLFSVFKDRDVLAEQYYDDGTPDSAIPLGWSHALRSKLQRLLKSYSTSFMF